MSSDGDWGDAESPDQRDRFDRWCRDFAALPRGNASLDAFCHARRITVDDLERVGARWQEPSTIAYYYAEGIKTRDLSRLGEPGGGRAAEKGAEFKRLRILPALEAGSDPAGVILAEGETDAARLVTLYPDHAVAVLPAGAKGPTEITRGQVANYPVIRVALDDDPAGNTAAAEWLEVPRAARLKPPGNDWCSSDEPHDGWSSLLAAPRRRVYTARELLAADLGTKAENNWFADGILPIGGFQMIHAAPKSLKSFLILEECRALASGTAFAGVHAFVRPHPARVLLYQYEIPAHDFQGRLISLVGGITDPDERDLVLDNLTVVGLADGTRPRLKIGADLLDVVRRDAEDAEADVVVFDPFQKMTGNASVNDAHELEPLFDAVDRLRAEDGLTVVGLHHNNKAERNTRDPLGMTGSQRFAADPDSIVSVWTPRGEKTGDGSEKSKTRNFGFELRNGTASPSSITVKQRLDDPDLVVIEFGPVVEKSDPDDEKPATDTRPLY